MFQGKDLMIEDLKSDYQPAYETAFMKSSQKESA